MDDISKIKWFLRNKTQKLMEDFVVIRYSSQFDNIYHFIRTNTYKGIFYILQFYYSKYLFFRNKYETYLKNPHYFYFVPQTWIINVLKYY